MKMWVALVLLLVSGTIVLLTFGPGIVTRQLEAKAASGDVPAMLNVAGRYYRGAGASQNLEKALYWYKQAAERGNAEAQYLVGVCYRDALGVAKDAETARQWLRKAALQGHGEAVVALGGEHDAELQQAVAQKGSEKDRLRLAAEQGDVGAQFALGSRFRQLERYEEAFQWLSKAANSGNGQARYELGLLYYAGKRPATLNKEQAFQLFMQAADQDVGEAQFNVGHMYSQGYGVSEDAVKAYQWMILAVTRHPALAAMKTGGIYTSGGTVNQALDKAKSKLSTRQVQQAEGEAKAWSPSGRR